MVGFVGKLIIVFIQRKQIPPHPKHPLSEWPKVSVIVPARNEEANIGRCVESLAKQTYPSDRYEVIVVDDHSEDRTAEILSELSGTYPQVKPIQARPLPKGWFGKSNGCVCGAQEAFGDFLFFLDADTWAEPEMLKAAVTFIEERKIDLLSLNPFQRMDSVAERGLLPGIFTAIATAMRFQESNTPGKPFAMASGQFMAFRRTAYDAVGGHEAVCKVLEEDMAFARLVKEGGHLLYWAFGDKIMNTRMYTDFAGIWEGFTKNLMAIMSCNTLLGAILTALRFLGLAWLPPVAVFWSLVAGADAWVVGVAVLTQAVMLIM
jgi:chlorobactene glucosyltransferase